MGADDKIDASLIPDRQQLEEVVVTALGIKRDKKMLGYAVQDVKGEALNTTGDPSVVGALDGNRSGRFNQNNHPWQLVAHRQQPASVDR